MRNINDFGGNIQAALDVGPGEVYLPPGVWSSPPLVINSPNVRLRGAGWSSVLNLALDSGQHGITFGPGADGITVLDLAVIGHSSPGSNQFAIMTAPAAPSNCKVQNVKFSGTNCGIKLNDGATNWEINGCLFSGLVGAASGDGYGVLCGEVLGNIFSRNHFVGSPNNGRHAVYLSAGASYNQVTGNVVTGFNQSAFPVYSRMGQPSCRRNTIEGNTVCGGGLLITDAAAIELAGQADHNIVVNNIITGFYGNGIIVTDAGTGGFCTDNVVANNIIDNVQWHGIYVAGTKRTSILNNRLCEYGQDGGWHVGVKIDSFGSFGHELCVDTCVLGNVIYGPQARAALELDQSDPAPTGTVIGGNYLGEGTAGSLLLNGVATVVWP